MKMLKIYPGSINTRFIDEAVATLRDGGVIIYPTDTLYAIGCDALNNRAVKRVCDIKKLDSHKERLSIVCSGLSQASEYARIDNRAYSIVKDCLPGPYTFILSASSRLPKEFKGRKEVGIRVPSNEITTSLTTALGHPLLSASIDFDADYPEEAVEPESIAMRYAHLADLMIDGGEGSVVGSTVVSLIDSSEPELLREGVAPFPID